MKNNFLSRSFIFIVILSLVFSQKSVSQVFYSQNNPSWSCSPLGHCPSYTIGSCPSHTAGGCTISCLCMLYNGAYTPYTLNAYLSAYGGYPSNDCILNWGTIPCGVIYNSNPTTTILADYANLYSNISAGRKAIVNVTEPGSGSPIFGHWVLVYGFTGGSTTTASNYKVYDPWPTSSTTYTNLSCYPSGFKNAHYYTMLGTFSTTAPSGISGSCGLVSTTENIVWTCMLGASGYEVSIKKASSSTWTIYNTTSGSYSFTGLSLSTAYNFRVRSFQCSTYGSYSTVYNFTTPAHRSSIDESTLNVNSVQSSNEIKVYPDPVATKSIVTVSLGGLINEKVTISVISINGQQFSNQVYDLNGSDIEFAAPEVKGFYLIKIISSAGWIETKKLLVL